MFLVNHRIGGLEVDAVTDDHLGIVHHRIGGLEEPD